MGQLEGPACAPVGGDAPVVHRAPDRWLSRTSITVAWAALLLAAVHPPDGLGVSVCWFKRTTGVPCPGCGLSRSLSAAVRGNFREAWLRHPFGPLLLAVFTGIAASSLLPARQRQRLWQALQRRSRVVNTVYVLLIGSFLLFGVARAVHHCRLRLRASPHAAQPARTDLPQEKAADDRAVAPQVAVNPCGDRAHKRPPSRRG